MSTMDLEDIKIRNKDFFTLLFGFTMGVIIILYIKTI